VTVLGLLTWTGGQMSGGGSTLADGGMLISGTGLKGLYGRTLTNAGRATWTGGDVNIEFDGTWNNLPGAVVDAQGNNRFGTDSVFHEEGAFNNLGTFLKSAGTGTTTGDVAFNNSGTVDAASGTLDLDGGGISAGAFLVEAGATLEFSGGTPYLLPASVVSGAGGLFFDSESFNNLNIALAGAVNVTGTSTFRAGVAEFDGSATLGGLTFTAGTLTGVGDLTIAGALNWTGGTMTGPGTTYANGATAVSGNGAKTLDGRTLVNGGTLTWTGGNFTVTNGAVLLNLAGALFDAQTDFTIVGTNSLFDNQGTFRKSAGTATTYVNQFFVNEGLVEIRTGTVTMTGDYTQTAAGTLSVNVGGLALGTQYTQLRVNGVATLDGTLTVNLVNGLVPPSGSRFAVLPYGALSGDFASLNLPDLGGHTFNLDYNGGLFLVTP
jgi:hypothetical protein